MDRNRRIAILTIIGLMSLVALMGWKATHIRFSVKLDRFFPEQQREYQFYQDFRQQFTAMDTRTSIAVNCPDGVFTEACLKRVGAVTDAISHLSDVEEAVSLTTLKTYIRDPFGLIHASPMVSIEDPDEVALDSARIMASDNLVGTFVGKDVKSLSIHLITPFDLPKSEVDTLIHHCKRILYTEGFDEFYIAGRLYSQSYLMEYMRKEMLLFVGIAALLVFVVFLLLYRSVWAVIGPFLVVACTTVALIGTMAIAQKPLDLLSSLIPAILFVIGMSDVIHLYTRYLYELRQANTSKRTALLKAYKEVGLATLITSLTTAIGFLSLMTASIAPIREFGLFTALGVMYAFVLSFSLYPAILYLLPAPDIGKGRRFSFSNPEKWMDRSLTWIWTHQGAISKGAILLFIACLFALSGLRINNSLMEELPDDDELRSSFTFFEDHYGGVRFLEMAIWPKDSTRSLMEESLVRQIASLESYIKQSYGTTSVFSLASVIRQANQASFGGDPAYAVIPDSGAYDRLASVLNKPAVLRRIRQLYDQEAEVSRISANIRDDGGYLLHQKHQQLHQFVQIHCPDLNHEQTGMAHLIDLNNRHLVHEMLQGLGVAFLLISIIMALLYRSVWVLLIALIPNIFPLIMVAATMYLLGIDLKVSTALIFSIAFGIAVDDTIHFLSKMQAELKKGLDAQAAIQHTFLTTGKSIILTSLILCAGFVSLSFSTFSSSHYLGMLISLTLLFAVLIDLLLLPILLKSLEKRI
ncbi:MAG: MMPL family transporter [Bacteroidota bacterium]